MFLLLLFGLIHLIAIFSGVIIHALLNLTVNAQLISGKNGYDYNSVRRWTSQKKLGYSLIECDKVNSLHPPIFLHICVYIYIYLLPMLEIYIIFFYYAQIFVPIHKEIHWCLAVINKKEGKFQYLDSLGGMDDEVLEVLVRFLVFPCSALHLICWCHAYKSKELYTFQHQDMIPSHIPFLFSPTSFGQ